MDWLLRQTPNGVSKASSIVQVSGCPENLVSSTLRDGLPLSGDSIVAMDECSRVCGGTKDDGGSEKGEKFKYHNFSLRLPNIEVVTPGASVHQSFVAPRLVLLSLKAGGTLLGLSRIYLSA